MVDHLLSHGEPQLTDKILIDVVIQNARRSEMVTPGEEGVVK